MHNLLPWMIAVLLAATVLAAFAYATIANRRRAAMIAHLHTHGIDSSALVVDARRSGFRVSNRRGWTLILAWRHPGTGQEHRLESDLIWRDNHLLDTVRAELKSLGELPVRIDPAAPEQFHIVDISILQTPGHA